MIMIMMIIMMIMIKKTDYQSYRIRNKTKTWTNIKGIIDGCIMNDPKKYI